MCITILLSMTYIKASTSFVMSLSFFIWKIIFHTYTLYSSLVSVTIQCQSAAEILHGYKMEDVKHRKKVKVIQEIENEKSKVDVCWEFSLVNSTVQMLSKNKNCDAFEVNELQIKWLWKPNSYDIAEALLKWFKQQRSDNSSSHG